VTLSDPYPRFQGRGGIHAGVQRRNREQKSFVEIKPVPVVKHV